MRLDLTTLELTLVTDADGRIRSLWPLRNRMYFTVKSGSNRDRLHVTDGTSVGTRAITVAGRPLSGVAMDAALFHNGSIYVTGFTRNKGDDLLDQGLYVFSAP